MIQRHYHARMGAWRFLALSTMLLHGSAIAQVRPIEQQWVLVRQPLKWESPPREIGLSTKTAPAEVVVLNPSGAFAIVYCYLIRQKDGAISISRGDSHTVAVGTWKREQNSITVRSRVVYTDALPIGKPIPGPETKNQFTASFRAREWRLGSGAGSYKPLSRLEDLEFLATMIRCDRSYWDGHKWIDGIDLPCMPPQPR
jgi:hypothetical protein